MKSEEIFAIWAPHEAIWSPWAKPILFTQMRTMQILEPSTGAESLDVSWAPESVENIVLMIDLPGAESIHVGLALAQKGYRPVPVYNACAGPGFSPASAVLDLTPLLDGVMWGTLALQRSALPAEAPPAFLLDANRISGTGLLRPGTFDNRWIVFPQDFPSANFLLSRQVQEVLVVQEGGTPKEDLSHVLLRWQEAGLRLLIKDPKVVGPPVELTVNRPSLFRSLWHGALARVGFRRNSAGGFGSIVPQASSGG